MKLPLAYICSIYQPMFRFSSNVIFDATAQHKVSVFQRFVADQPVQFCAVKAVVRDLVLHCDTVDGNHAAVSEKQLHAGRVDIEFAGNQFAHVENLRVIH